MNLACHYYLYLVLVSLRNDKELHTCAIQWAQTTKVAERFTDLGKLNLLMVVRF